MPRPRLRSRPAIALSSALLLALAGCGGGGSQEADARVWTTTVDTLPSGVVQVVNTPPAGGVVPTHGVIEELRIGTMEGGGPTSFGQIKGLAVTEDGRIAVLDAQAQEIRVFGPDGTHLVTHGGKGEGPGEFMDANGLMLGPDGDLRVPDHGNARLNVVDPTDGFVDSEPYTVLSYGWVWRGAMLDDGRLLEPTLTLEPPRRDILKIYGAELQPVDSFDVPAGPEVDREDPPTSMFWEAPDGTGAGYMGIPYAESGALLFHPEGAIWSAPALAESHRLIRTTFAYDTTRVVETARTPRPLPTEFRDSLIGDMQERIRERSGDIKGQSWEKFPTRLPFVERILVAANGDLWVETGTLEGSEWDVFDAEGRWLRTVAVDLSFLQWVAPVIRGDTIWAVVTDDFDVPYVVRARVSEVSPPQGAGSG